MATTPTRTTAPDLPTIQTNLLPADPRTRNTPLPPGALVAAATGHPAPATPDLTTWPDLLVQRPTRSKGTGTFAARPLPAHARILSDSPLVTLAAADDLPALAAAHAALTPAQRRIYDRLAAPAVQSRDDILAARLRAAGTPPSETAKAVQLARVFHANAFNARAAQQDPLSNPKSAPDTTVQRVLCPRIARLNHSCAPTAHAVFIPGSDPGPGPGTAVQPAMRVTTLRPISAGEELTLAYFDPTAPRSDRARRAAAFGFACACAVCAEPLIDDDDDDDDDDDAADDAGELERRRAALRSARAAAADGRPSASASAGANRAPGDDGLSAAREALALACAEAALAGYVPSALEGVAAALVGAGDGRGAAECMWRAAFFEGLLGGEDSPDAVRRRGRARDVQRAIGGSADGDEHEHEDGDGQAG